MTTTYNTFEKLLARILGKNPALKARIKQVHSRIAYSIYKKTYRYNSILPFSVISPEQTKESFFGYYDKTPCSKEGIVLFHSSLTSTQQVPNPDSPVAINGFDLNQNVAVSIAASSAAYNWQQGTRLHWLDDDSFVFNDFDKQKSRYIARIYSLSSGRETSRFSRPVQDSFQKEYFLSLNYERLQAVCPDYGYGNLPLLADQELKNHAGDGIWRIDYDSGQEHLIIPLDTIIKTCPKAILGNALHSVNHVMISPCGHRFVFIHRYYIDRQRFDRLMLADAQGNDLKVLADNKMVSHCVWLDDNTILSYLRNNEGRDGFWFIDLNQDSCKEVLQGRLNRYGDGHPHVYGDWFITDTYPDKARMQHLILCNWKSGTIIELGEFFHGFAYQGGCRCDLHPRFSPDGKTVFFDSVFDDKRRMYRMDVSSIVDKD
jgi:hypothetical protein